MSLFPDEDVLTREIETWRGFMEKLPSEDDKAVLTKLLNDCYKYSVAINNHAQIHSFPSESLIMSLLLIQDKLLNQLKSMMQSRHEVNRTNLDGGSNRLRTSELIWLASIETLNVLSPVLIFQSLAEDGNTKS